MSRRLVTTLSLALILFTAAALAASDNGKLVVAVERVGDSYRVVSSTAYPDAPAPLINGGNAKYKLLGADGAEIASGSVMIPTFVAQEYADETGMMHGRLEKVESFTLTMPLVNGVTGIELKRGKKLLLDEHISPELYRPIRVNTASPSDPVSFAPLLKAMTAEPGRISPSVRSVDPAKKDKVTGSIKVKGIKDTSLLRAVIDFYPVSGELSDRTQTESDENGEFKIKLKRGTYRVTAYCYYQDPDYDGAEVLLYPGSVHISTFDSTTKTIKFKWKKNTLFSGQLMNGSHSISGEVWIVDRASNPETHKTYIFSRIQTDENGRFGVRLPRKNFVMIAIPQPGSSAGEMLSIVKVKKNNVDVPFNLPALGSVGGDALKKIWDSGPEADRLNIMFLADAYTDGHESFTDTNGNGWWDGDILMDANNNGVRDEGEYFFDRNGNRIYEAPEPFTDENGDGICNRFERARFELDAALAAKALLEFPPFDQYANVINVYTLWQASEHGMPRFTQIPKWASMNTAWGVYGTATDGFQSARLNSNPKPEAYTYLPNALELVPVVLSHDPVNALRANAQFGFGRVLLSAEDHRAGAVLIHELGHSIGNLWDEYLYSDSPSQYFGIEPNVENVTMQTNPSLAKWSDLIEGDIEVPTPENQDGYGLFEGAGSYSLGIYRSTAISMMRATSYPFFIVNERALAAILEQFR